MTSEKIPTKVESTRHTKNMKHIDERGYLDPSLEIIVLRNEFERQYVFE